MPERPIYLFVAHGSIFLDMACAWLQTLGFTKGNDSSNSPGKQQPFYLTYKREDTDEQRQWALGRLQLATEDQPYQPLCLLASIKMVSESLNLQACSKTLVIDEPWLWTEVDQLVGRTHRIGQKRVTAFGVLLVQDTHEVSPSSQRVGSLF